MSLYTALNVDCIAHKRKERDVALTTSAPKDLLPMYTHQISGMHALAEMCAAYRVTVRSEGCSQPRELWFSIYSCMYVHACT